VTTDRATTESGETLGARIRRLRLAKGLSQKQLAGPGVDDSYISLIEGNRRRPSLEVLGQIAGRLGVDPHYLKTGSSVTPTKERELRLADAELSLRLGDDLDHAEAILRGLLDEEVPDGLEARVRATLGGVVARRGYHHEAIEQLAPIVAAGAFHPCVRPDVYETLSRSYLATGASLLAIKLLEDAIEAADAEERYAVQRIRFRVFLATALSAIGAFERAQRELDEASRRAEGVTPPEVRISVAWETARVAWNRGDSDEALQAINYARALAEVTEDVLVIARSHVLASELHTCEGRPEQAREHLRRAESILSTGADPVDRGLLRVEQARVEAALGDPQRALAYAREADQLLHEHVRHKANGQHALGVAYAAVGDIDAADGRFDAAVSLLLERGQWREALVVVRDWAAALRAAGRDEKAYEVLERSTRFSRYEGAAVMPESTPPPSRSRA
jgi:transcriptional regulator with XRE-family HTH domain